MNVLKSQNKNETGFTIIEVILVLAIAGLIFLTVFLALPALQRNQRDAERKKNVAELMTAIITYKSNNRGQLPSTSNDSWPNIERYWNRSELLREYRYSVNNSRSNHIDDFTSDGDLRVVERWKKPTKKSDGPGEWIIAKGVQCSLNDEGGWQFVGGSESRGSFAVLLLLETFKPRNGWSYCLDLNNFGSN